MNKKYDPLSSVQAAGPPGTISFIYGLPDPDTFPVPDLQDCFSAALKKNSNLSLQYGPEQGYGPLIDYLRERTLREEGLRLARSQIMLSCGASQALDHILSLFTRPGDYALVEAPTYHEALQLFKNHGINLIQIPVDGDGLRVESLESCLSLIKREGKEARLLYIIPNYQNPSGTTLSKERRKGIMHLLKDEDILVVEDDVYCDLRFEGSKMPSLFSLDQRERTVRLHSFSKIIAPGLRLGWFEGPDKLIKKMIDSGLRRMGGGVNPLVSNAVAFYCRQGNLESHIEAVCSVYKKRRDIMLESLKSMMPEGITWTKPKGGFFIWITLPDYIKAADAAEQAEAEGLLILPGNPFFADAAAGQHLRLAYSYVDPRIIRKGIEKLANIFLHPNFSKE